MAPTKKPVTKHQAVISGRVLRSGNRSSAATLDPSKIASLVEEVVDPIPVTPIPVDGSPPAWAECRPELCDALPWFRSVQGGVYHSGNICLGFLLDADCGIRSHIDDEVIITRVGGGCTKDAQGNLTLIKDQDCDGSALTSLYNSKELKIPIGIIIGNRNTVLGRQLPHRYNVMDYFLISDIWFEKVGERKGAKVRFEKLDLSAKSWWAVKGSPEPVAYDMRDNNHVQPQVEVCFDCGLTSTQIYNEGWMCLSPGCRKFWKINGAAPMALTFHPNFLNYRMTPSEHIKQHYSLVPDLLSSLKESTLRISWRGIVCPRCSKCISRRFWQGWKCTDDDIASGQPGNPCLYQKMMPIDVLSLRSVIDEFEISPIKRALYFDSKYLIPEVDDITLYPYRKLTYNIPRVGSITHLVSSRTINSRANGPNDLFDQLQQADLDLRRYPLQQSVVAGTLTAHFAVNYGMPYKYVVSVGSKGFDEAPCEILRALGRLSWATEKAVSTAGHQPLSPNELLLLGYLEGMKIGYHDDGESSLGPTIATLSLGAKSTMLIRMKYKYYHGQSKAKVPLADDPILEGCELQKQRQALRDQLIGGHIAQVGYEKRLKELLRQCRSGEAAPTIKMELNHGDLVVMHGSRLQKYFEHSVIPDSRLRFALTARYIKPEGLSAEELKKGQFTLSPDQIYDGQ